MREERKRERERENKKTGVHGEISGREGSRRSVSVERGQMSRREQSFRAFFSLFMVVLHDFFGSQFQGLFLFLHNQNAGGIKTRRKTDSGLCLLALPFLFLVSFLL